MKLHRFSPTVYCFWCVTLTLTLKSCRTVLATQHDVLMMSVECFYYYSRRACSIRHASQSHFCSVHVPFAKVNEFFQSFIICKSGQLGNTLFSSTLSPYYEYCSFKHNVSKYLKTKVDITLDLSHSFLHK